MLSFIKEFFQDPSQFQRNDQARRNIVDTFEFTYGPLVLTFGLCLFFVMADGAHEVIIGFLTMLDDGWFADPNGQLLTQANVSKVLSLVLLPAVQVFNYSLAYNTLLILDEFKPWSKFTLGLIPVGCMLAFPAGIYLAYTSPEATQISLRPLLWLAISYALMIGHAAYVLFSVGDKRDAKWVSHSNLRRIRLGFVALALLLIGYGLLAGFINPHLGPWIGPIGMAASFVVVAAAILSALTLLSTFMPGRFPLFFALLILVAAMNSLTAVLVFGVALFLVFLFGLGRGSFWRSVPLYCVAVLALLIGWMHLRNTNCESLSGCNLVQGAEISDRMHPNVVEAFTAFEANLAPDDPVYIVAAQGGGLFAAQHAATYLAARADRDDQFRNGLFAISGVSGGSVGAGVYWAVRKSGKCTGGDSCHLDAVRDIVERDYLSPALAGLLYMDNLDTFFPISSLYDRPMDRGKVMEDAFAREVHRWQHGSRHDDAPRLLDMPMSASSDGTPGVPFLYFNATRVDDGTRYVFSPVRSFDLAPGKSPPDGTDPNAPGTFTHFELANGNGLSVANAMIISARFPFVTPPARLRQKTVQGSDDLRHTLQMADGGYFDNSGLETVLDIVIALRKAGITRKIEIVSLNVNEYAAAQDPAKYQPPIKGTVGAPMSAFFGAWRARIPQTQKRMADILENPDIGNNTSACAATLETQDFNFTLSWYLARGTFEDIAHRVKQQIELPPGFPPLCHLQAQKSY